MKLLLVSIKTTISKAKAKKLASIVAEDNYSIKDLIDLSFNADHQIGFRSAWILENVYSNYPESFVPYINYFLKKFPRQDNPSALRHYVKILAYMTKSNASKEIKQVLNDYNTDEIVEIVFTWLIDHKIPVAVKSHCLNILANLVPKHPWVMDELIQTMEFLVDKESVGFLSKVKQIRKQFSV